MWLYFISENIKNTFNIHPLTFKLASNESHFNLINKTLFKSNLFQVYFDHYIMYRLIVCFLPLHYHNDITNTCV